MFQVLFNVYLALKFCSKYHVWFASSSSQMFQWFIHLCWNIRVHIYDIKSLLNVGLRRSYCTDFMDFNFFIDFFLKFRAFDSLRGK